MDDATHLEWIIEPDGRPEVVVTLEPLTGFEVEVELIEPGRFEVASARLARASEAVRFGFER